MQDHDFDTVLRNRAAPPARAGLADRIIAASRSVPQMRGMGDVLADYLLPKNVAALAAMLVMGAAIGLSIPVPGNEDEFSMQTYIDDNGAVL